MRGAVTWPRCDHCGEQIPQFEQFAESDRQRILQLIWAQPNLAAAELCACVGCDLRLAKVWVEHRGRPIPVVPGPPCRFCGAALATSLARQCLACGADWHDREPAPE